MKTEQTIYDPAEHAALYAAGALPPHEAAALEARLAAKDPLLAEEILTYQDVVTALSDDAVPIDPEPGTKQAIIEMLAALGNNGSSDPTSSPASPERPPEIFIRRASLGGWQKTPISGLEVCVLFRDPGRNLQTSLLRAAPGFKFPAHEHSSAEECYVIEGDFHTFDTVLLAGDYVRAPAGSFHPICRTEEGCLLLLTSEIKPDPRRRLKEAN